MSATLYDVLEVSRSADQESIVAAYKRRHAELAARISGIEGADHATLDRMSILREAFGTLADPERRKGYDLRLTTRGKQAAAIVETPSRSILRTLMLLTLAGTLGLGYAQFHSEQQKARQERERIEADARSVDLQLQRERAEKRAAALADLERRRDEAMERFLREQIQGSQGKANALPQARLQS